MWYLKKGGVRSGPFTDAQVRERLNLGMAGPLDGISSDGQRWQTVRDSEFWKQERTIPDPHASRGVRKISLVQPQPTITTVSPPPGATSLLPQVPPNVPPQSSEWAAPSPSRPRFHNWWLAVIIPSAAAVLAIALFFAFGRSGSRGLPDGSGVRVSSGAEFKAAQDKLAIIECGGGSGSGFLAKMDGKTYLVSNEHVFRGSSAPKATLLDGTVLELGAFSVAEDRDLARFEVPDAKVGFTISDELPSTSDFCAIYGNSGGEGVATELKGKITGVGPRAIETDVEFIGGNSGSPMLNAKGEVIGAADRTVNSKAVNEFSGNWTAKDTQFDSVRRFAARLNANVKWITLDRNEYERQVARFEVLKLFVDYLGLYYIVDVAPEESNIVPHFTEQDAKAFYGDQYGFAECLANIAKAYEKRERVGGGFFGLWASFCQIEDEEGRRRFWNENKLAQKWEKTKDVSNAFLFQMEKALVHGKAFISQNRWDAPQLKDGHCVDTTFADEGVNYWQALFDEAKDDLAQRKRDLEKAIKEFEGDDDDE